ncbi:hypothetical protein DL96DRAFT_730816 [Flagelloscypha sp. PMI_526]|nr:hypothetical protein DL96DRAFT_730816 [Flagelloscypha sp. PMI_526]
MANPAQDDEKRGLALLSLDSGRFESLSGLSQLFILREILRTYEYDNELEEDTAKVYEAFDLIVGTGSGGLVACLVGPLRMPVEEAIQAYLGIHRAVFIQGEGNVSAEELTCRLKAALCKLIEDRLSPEEQASRFSAFNKLYPGCMIAVTALSKVNVQNLTAFRSFQGRRGCPPPCNLLDTALSTLAHPHLFSSVTLQQGSITHQFIAADLGYCNPLDTLVNEIKDQFKDRSIALIVTIGTGLPSPISLEGDDSFAHAASELAISCNDVSDRFEKMLQTHSGAFVRLNADGYDISLSLSPEDVIAHTEAYTRKAAVAEKLEVVGESLKERPNRIKVSETSFPKVGSVERLHHAIQAIPQRASTFDAVNRLPYAERATFNPSMACYSGTRLHLLSVIYEWMKQESYSQPILWLKGLFGTGKSALSHSVALEASNRKVLASTFFMTPGAAPRDVVSPRTQLMNMPSIDNLVSTLLRDLRNFSIVSRCHWSRTRGFSTTFDCLSN